MRTPRPLARAWKRLSIGAGSTSTRVTFRSSTSALKLLYALAIAESNTLRTIFAPFFGMNFNVLTASVADLPRIVSTTKRHFCGEMRAYRKIALVCMPYSAADTFLSPECALNVRGGANSPSLWPTMFSDTNTGTCKRPLCTAMVKPTISGMTMERRDQVLIGRRSFFWLAVCTFLARCKSTNGPFLSERGTDNSPVLQSFVLATLNDHAVSALVATRLLALGLQAPWAH